MQAVVIEHKKEHSNAMKESLRALRTNLKFCGDDIKTILITSSLPDEGKSSVAMDLARSLAEADKKVVLIDTDMRNSVLIGRLCIKTTQKEMFGLSHYLSGQKKLEDVLYSTNLSGVSIIFAGPSVPNPTEILEKKYFEEMIAKVRADYDYVIVDCAPITAAIDAAVVAKHCDGAILVISQGIASSRLIAGVKKQLEATGVKILGAVLNKVKTKKKGYGYGYGHYYGYSNYYGDDDKQPETKRK